MSSGRRRRRVDPNDVVAIASRVRKDGVRVYLPYVYDPSRPSGKRWLGTFTDLGEAQRKRDEARLERRPDSGMKVAAFIELFLRTDGWAPGTRDRYRSGLRPVKEEFGDRYCDDLSALEASVWGRTQPLGVTDVARTLFYVAVRHGVATHNPFANLRRKRSRGRADIQTLTEPEVLDLAECANDIWGEFAAVVRAQILFAAYTGMRPAEIWALRWADIRWASEEIRVEWQFKPMGQERIKEVQREARRNGKPLLVVRGGVLTPPKSGRPRTIVLLDEAAAALRSLPRRLASDFVFLTTEEALFSKPNWHRYWNPVRAAYAATLPGTHWLRKRMRARGQAGDFDFYELRHLCATIMVNDGKISAADVAEQLGHQDGGKLVRELYGHPSKELARARIRAGMRARNARGDAAESVASLSQHRKKHGA